MMYHFSWDKNPLLYVSLHLYQYILIQIYNSTETRIWLNRESKSKRRHWGSQNLSKPQKSREGGSFGTSMISKKDHPRTVDTTYIRVLRCVKQQIYIYIQHYTCYILFTYSQFWCRCSDHAWRRPDRRWYTVERHLYSQCQIPGVARSQIYSDSQRKRIRCKCHLILGHQDMKKKYSLNKKYTTQQI